MSPRRRLRSRKRQRLGNGRKNRSLNPFRSRRAPRHPRPSRRHPNLAAPPRDYGDFERRFGTQWVVWVGGLALALGGIFLVRYSIEAGLFTPGLRIIFGAILALFLVALGEIARRREIVTGISQINAAHIPSILTAAGTTIAYADVWAAYALYNFVPAGAAFVLLGLVALATLAAALVHGPGLAGLGLVGAYITPVLVGSDQPNYWALYVYLAVVTAAAYALARMRLWRWLAITAACFSLLWMLVGLTLPEQIGPHAFHAVAGFALASAFIVAGLLYGPEAQRGRYDLVSCGILAGYLLGAFLLVFANRHDAFAVVTLFVLCAATVAVAWRSEAVTPAIAAAALLAVLVVGHWSTSDYFVYLHRPGGPLSGLPLVLKVEGLRAASAVRYRDRAPVRRCRLSCAGPRRASLFRDPVGRGLGAHADPDAGRAELRRHRICARRSRSPRLHCCWRPCSRLRPNG